MSQQGIAHLVVSIGKRRKNDMPKIGILVRCDKSGLGSQTLRLARLLNPAKVMIIDSTPFNGNDQHPMWFKDWPSIIIRGFPTNAQIESFLEDLDVLISCETFYSGHLTHIARTKGVKTILIANYEFLDYLQPVYYDNIPLPDKIITPSYWHLDELQRQFNAEYLPTPLFDDEFKAAREVNLKRTGKPRYLFLNGKTAAHDRAGLNSLYEALQVSKGDFEVVVKSQSEIKKHPDPRLTYDFSNPDEQCKLYEGFDAMIHPRRYGGQSLQVSEGLLSGLPVIMTDTDPNNKVLPKVWLVDACKTGEFMTRTMIDIHSADALDLANTLDTLDCGMDAKKWAYEIGRQYEAENLREQYERVIYEL